MLFLFTVRYIVLLYIQQVMADESDSIIDSQREVKNEESAEEDREVDEVSELRERRQQQSPSLLLGSRLEEPSNDSAMARLLLASSMAQRDMAVNDRETPTSALNLSKTDHSRKRPYSPYHQNSAVSGDVASVGSSGHSQSPPVSDLRRNSGSPSDRQEISQMDGMPGEAVDYGKDATYMLPDSSPESSPINSMLANVYKCRLCSFCASTYTQLQLHMPKHGSENYLFKISTYFRNIQVL